MGGSGSGDWQDGRPLTCERARLDCRALRRAGLRLAARGAPPGSTAADAAAPDADALALGPLTVAPVYPAADADALTDAAGPLGAAWAVDVADAAGDAWLAALLRAGRRYAAPATGSRAADAPRGPTPSGSAAVRRAFAAALERSPWPTPPSGADAVRAAFAAALEAAGGGNVSPAPPLSGGSDTLTISAKPTAADAGEGAHVGRLR